MRKVIPGSLVVLGLGTLAAVLLWQRSLAPGDAPASESSVNPVAGWSLGLRFEPGVVEHYGFTYSQETRADPIPTSTGSGTAQNASTAIRGDVALSGRFSMEGRAAATDGGDVAELLFRFEALDQHRFAVLGKDLLPDAASVQEQLLGEAALVSLSERGEVRKISFSDDAHPMFERMVQLVLSESQLFLDATAQAWERQEQGLHGEAQTAYRLIAKDAQRAQVEKRRSEYSNLQALKLHQGALEQQLAYTVTATISRQGRLLRLRGDERLAATAGGKQLLAVTAQVELEHLRSSPGGQALATAFKRSRQLGEVGFSEEAERRTLRQRVDGLTRAQVLADLDRFGFGARMPDHNQWLWRSAGLIRLEPELVDELVAMFPSKKFRHEGRGLILDLLVGAQTYRAQEGLLTALHTEAAQRDDRYHLLFQRLNLVSHPSPETVAFLEQTQARSTGMQQALATNALGSAAGHLFRAGELKRGQAIGDRLLQQLEEQSEATGQVLYLTALGNASLPHHADSLRGYARAPSSKVRWQTAASLRKFTDDASRATLIELAQDPVERVQLRALASLHARKDLSDSDVVQIGTLVSQHRFVEGSYHSVVTLLSSYLKSDPGVRDIFRTMLTHDLKDPDSLARIRAILGR